MILVDTSAGFRPARGRPALTVALKQAMFLRTRSSWRSGLWQPEESSRGATTPGKLPGAPVATDREALDFIERRDLMGRGIGTSMSNCVRGLDGMALDETVPILAVLVGLPGKRISKRPRTRRYAAL